MNFLRFLAFILFPCLAFGEEKKISFNIPPAPAADYTHAKALGDLSQLPGSEAALRLHPWLLSQCFGGGRPESPALQHPRVAQALWLALMTEAIGRKVMGAEDAVTYLDYLISQKALDTPTVSFFRNLWVDGDIPANSRSQRAADFLRIWLAAFHPPSLEAVEARAIASAVAAGMRSFDFFPAPTPSTFPEKK